MPYTVARRRSSVELLQRRYGGAIPVPFSPGQTGAMEHTRARR
jgi:hypothetical protein